MRLLRNEGIRMILGRGGGTRHKLQVFLLWMAFLPKNSFISHNSGNKTMKKLFKKFKSY